MKLFPEIRFSVEKRSSSVSDDLQELFSNSDKIQVSNAENGENVLQGKYPLMNYLSRNVYLPQLRIEWESLEDNWKVRLRVYNEREILGVILIVVVFVIGLNVIGVLLSDHFGFIPFSILFGLIMFGIYRWLLFWIFNNYRTALTEILEHSDLKYQLE